MPLPGVSNTELIARAASENSCMRFQWWQTVLLEWDSNLANSCSVIEKEQVFRNELFLEIFIFLQPRFCQWLGKNHIDTKKTTHSS